MKVKLTNSETVVDDKGNHMELWTLQSLVSKAESAALRKKMGDSYEIQTKP